MTREEYIQQKLGSLSAFDKLLVEEMVAQLGEWSTVGQVSKYFKKHRNTIHSKLEEEIVIYRKMGTSILIHTRSLIFLLE